MTPKYPKLNFDGMVPFPLQRVIMDHPARFKSVAFGRQSGKSWMAKRILLEKAANQGLRCWWVAPTIGVAKDHWTDLVRKVLDSGIPHKRINNTDKEIEFYSGGSIRIRSADIPDNLRGGTLDFLILDEAAFMRDSVWWKILQPTLTASRGSAMLLSTPFGQNWFYLLYRMGLNPAFPDFMSWTMPSWEAPYQDKEMLAIIKKTVPDSVWREEYGAEFLADSGGVFAGLDKIVPREMLLAPLPGHVYVAGIDWGLEEDDTIFTVADKYTRQQVYGDRINSIGTKTQLQWILDHMGVWHPDITHIERNGVGGPMYRLIKEELNLRDQGSGDSMDSWLGLRDGSRMRIRDVFLNNAKKRQMIETLAANIEYSRFDPLVRTDETDIETYGAIQMSQMSTFKRTRTASGLEITYGAAEGYHDDTVMGLALCGLGLDDASASLREIDRVRDQKTVKKLSKRSPFATTNRPRESGRENTRARRRSF